MKTLLKWIFLAALTVVVLAGIGIGILLFAVDPNDYKPEIQSLASDQGVDLEIRGDLGWQFLPSVAITVSDTQVSGEGLPDISFQQASLALDLGKLIGGEIAVNEVALNKPVIRIDLAAENASEQAAAVAAAPLAAGKAESPTGSVVALNIKTLSLTDGTLELVEQGVVQQRIENLNITSQQLNLAQQAFPIKVAFNTAVTDVAERLSLQFQANVALDGEFQHIALSEGTLKVAVESSELGNHTVDVRFATIVDLVADTLSLPSAEITLDGVPLTVNADISKLTSVPAINGKLTIPTFEPQSLLSQLNIDPASIPVKQLSLTTDIETSGDRYKLANLKLAMDDFSLTGNATAVFRTAPGATNDINATLNGTTLNLDAYLPASEETDDTTTADSTAQAEALFAPLLAPLAMLNGGKGQVEISLQQLITQGVQLDNVHINAFSNGSVIQLTDLSANGFSGTVKSDAKVDLSKPTPTLQFNAKANGVDLYALLSTLADFSDLSGHGNLTLTGTAQGNSVEEIEKSLNANGTFAVTTPEFAGMNIEKSICEMVAIASKKPVEQKVWPEETKFGDTTGTFQVVGQQAKLTRFNSSTGNLKIATQGVVDLETGTYKMLVNANVQGNATSETGCSVNKYLRNRDIPVHVFGNLDGELNYEFDRAFKKQIIAEIATRLLTDRLFGKQDDKESDTAEEKEEDPLKGLLKDFFKKKLQ